MMRVILEENALRDFEGVEPIKKFTVIPQGLLWDEESHKNQRIKAVKGKTFCRDLRVSFEL